MGPTNVLATLVLLSLCSGILADLGDEVLKLEQVEAAARDTADAGIALCSIPGFGPYGKPAPSDAGAAAAVPGTYGAYGPAAGQYGDPSSAGQYGAAAAPGQYGAAAAESAAAAFLQSQQCTPLVTSGRLLAVGGIVNCTGSFTPMSPMLAPLTAAVATDSEGRFKERASTLGMYTWSANSKCVDRITNLPLTYNWQLVAPAYNRLIVTDLALLTAPASQHLEPEKQGSPAVFDQIFKAFGVDQQKLRIDVITYENVTSSSAVWPALMGLNAQLSFLADAIAHTMLALFQGPSAEAARHQGVNPQLSHISGIHEAIYNVLMLEAEGDGRQLLVSRDLIRLVLNEAVRLNYPPRWNTSSDHGLEVLLDNVARIVANSNKNMLKPIVDVALSCATAQAAGMPRLAPECASLTLAIAVASVTTLQKRNMTADIAALANAYVNTGSALNTPDMLSRMRSAAPAAAAAVAAAGDGQTAAGLKAASASGGSRPVDASEADVGILDVGSHKGGRHDVRYHSSRRHDNQDGSYAGPEDDSLEEYPEHEEENPEREYNSYDSYGQQAEDEEPQQQKGEHIVYHAAKKRQNGRRHQRTSKRDTHKVHDDKKMRHNDRHHEEVDCSKDYNQDSCTHDLRPECDYNNYAEGYYPPDTCQPYKSFPQSEAYQYLKAVHFDDESFEVVEPDGVVEVPKKKKGMLGLLGLLGLIGIVGVIPAGGLLVNSLGPVPVGTILILPGLVLAPLMHPLSQTHSLGVMPWSFGGNCGPLGGKLSSEQIPGNVPHDVLGMIPNTTCLPAGWLYKLPNLTAAGFPPSVTKLPAGTIVLKNDTIYVPKKDNSTVKSLVKSIPAIESTEWITPKKADEVKVVETNGTNLVMVAALPPPPSGMRLSSAQAEQQQQQQSNELQNSTWGPKPLGMFHGSAACLSAGAPPASCPAQGSLSPLGPLAKKPAKPQVPADLEGAFMGIGYIQGCAGDYYSYNEYNGAVEDVEKLSVDRTFNLIFKDFITGKNATAKQTYGAFGVANVTGRGHAFLTNTWACSDKIPQGVQVCLDSWTGVQVKVPIGGLTPYPRSVQRNKKSNVDVIITPAGLLTLNTSTAATSIYQTVYQSLGINTSSSALAADPIRMVKSGRTSLVKEGVAIMAENAKILNTLTTARALYECRSSPFPQLSNELFVQWADKLVTKDVMTSTSAFLRQIKELCLDSACSQNAAAVLMALNKHLSTIKAKYDAWPKEDEPPLNMVEDLIRLAQVAQVAQEGLYYTIRDCCEESRKTATTSSTDAAADGPQKLTGLLQQLEDQVASAPVRFAEIQAAAAISLGGGIGSSSSKGPTTPDAAGDAGNDVNNSADGSSSLDMPESATTSMVGNLLNSGGLQNCKGVMFPMVEGESPVLLETDAQGQFVVDEPLEARYKFSSSIPGSSCIDGMTGVPVTFPIIQQLPATLASTITAISMLAGPAKDDPSIREQVSVNGMISPELLVNYVYRLYGLDADELDVDFFSFTGTALQIGSPRLAQVSGAIAQTMSTFMSAHSLLTGLFGSQVPSDQIANCIVTAAYQKIASEGNAIVTLADQGSLKAIFEAAFNSCKPPSRRRALLQHQPAVSSVAPAAAAAASAATMAASAAGNNRSTNSSQAANLSEEGVYEIASIKDAPANLDQLLSAAAAIMAASNKKIQEEVVQADRAASSDKHDFNIKSAMANISSVAAVQQSEITHALEQLAATVATDAAQAGADVPDIVHGIVATQISEVEQEFTGENLNTLISSKAGSITPTAVADVLVNIGKPVVVDDDGHIGPVKPLKPSRSSSRPSPAIIAVAVVVSVVGFAAFVVLIVVLYRRNTAAAAASGPVFAAAGNSGSRAAGGGGLKMLPFISRRKDGGGDPGSDSSEADGDDATPRSTAGPVAESVFRASSRGGGAAAAGAGGSSGSTGGVAGSSGGGSDAVGSLLMINPLFKTRSGGVRAPGRLSDMSDNMD